MTEVFFPNLFGGFVIRVTRVAFTIFGVDIYWYGLIIGIGFALAVFLALRNAKRHDLVEDDIINILLIAVPIAIIFARLFYVVFYTKNWTFAEIINIRDGGLAIYGAIIGGMGAAAVYTWIKKINFLALGDLAGPYFALAQAIGRWGNFVNQEAFGYNTNLPWGMTSQPIQNELSLMAARGVDVNPYLPVHPTFLYESVWNFLTFILLVILSRKKKFNGQIFCLYMALYGFGRMFIEGLRTDSLMLGNIRVSQLIGLAFFLVFTIILLLIYLKDRKEKRALEDEKDMSTGTSEFASILKENIKLSDDEEASSENTIETDVPKEPEDNPNK
ncbi:MAG: prolipoprotein diacylglyceryl transferase [Clostridia bacterium]|nr:prolipoprotein diacylglyceryl transferase [Clostridia bacterium]MBN2882334.1 prolipoprotein diacylglyceryl transferase [Clostridia bacterium]